MSRPMPLYPFLLPFYRPVGVVCIWYWIKRLMRIRENRKLKNAKYGNFKLDASSSRPKRKHAAIKVMYRSDSELTNERGKKKMTISCAIFFHEKNALFYLHCGFIVCFVVSTSFFVVYFWLKGNQCERMWRFWNAKWRRQNIICFLLCIKKNQHYFIQIQSEWFSVIYLNTHRHHKTSHISLSWANTFFLLNFKSFFPSCCGKTKQNPLSMSEYFCTQKDKSSDETMKNGLFLLCAD